MERTTRAAGHRQGSGRRWPAVALAASLALGVMAGASREVWAQQPPAQVALTPEQEHKAKTLLQQGKESWEQKNYERVIRKYRQFVGEFPNRPEVTEARYRLAISMIEMNQDWNAVADELSKVVAAKDAPNKADANYWLGVALRVTGGQQLEAARANANEAQRKEQEAKAKERLSQAAAAFARVEGGDADLGARAKVEGAQTLLLIGKADEAVSRVKPFATDAALAKSPARPAGLLILGRAQFEAGDHPGAFQTLATIAPFDQPIVGPQARYLIGRILEETDQKPEAVVQYEAVAKAYTEERLKAQRALGDANAWKGKVLERLEAEGLVRGIPEFVLEANFHAGMIQAGYGQFAESLPKFKTIVEQAPKWDMASMARLELGICGVQAKQPDVARVLESMREDPKLGDRATWWVGRWQRSQADPANPGQAAGQYKAAIDSFTKAAAKAQALAASDPSAVARRGDILLDQADTHVLLKQYKEAATLYDQLAKDTSDPQRAESAHEKLAMSLHKAGDFTGSEQACAGFLEKYPRSALRGSVMFWQAENAYRQGAELAKKPETARQGAQLQEQAVARYQAVLEKYPEIPQAAVARFGLGMASYARGEYAKARKVFNGIPGPDRQGELLAASYYEADCLLKTAPDSAEDALSAGRLAKQLEEATALLSGYVGSNEETPQMPDAMLKLADCYRRSGLLIADQQEKARLFQGARETYDKLIQKYPKHPAMARAVMERALMLAATGDAGGAINELNRFRADATLARSEVAPAALMKLSALMVKHGRAVDAAAMMEKARSDFEKALAADPRTAPMVAQMRYHHGVALREAGKAKEALALFEGVIKEWPGSAEAAEASLASLQVRQKEALEKLKAARQAIASVSMDKPCDPKLLGAREEAIKVASEVADALTKHAERIAENAEGSDLHVRTLRDAALTWRAVGEAQVEAAQRTGGEASLKKLQARLAQKPRPPGKSNSSPKAPQIKLATIPLQAGEKQARELYGKALEAAPDAPASNELRLELADMHIARGEADPAIQLIGAAIDHNPPQPVLEQLRVRLGQCHLLKNDANAAMEQAMICLQDTNSPIRPSAYLLKGRAFMAQKNWGEAVTTLTRYLNGAEKYRNAGPVTEAGLMALAEASRSAGAWEPAVAAYQNLIQRFPSSPLVADAWFGMGRALEQGRQFDRAIQAYTEATRKTNSETAARAQLQIGLCRAEQKRWQDAVNELLVVPLTYDYAEVCANSSLAAARALVELKQKDQAKEVLRSVVEDHPMTVWAQEAQKRLAEIQ